MKNDNGQPIDLYGRELKVQDWVTYSVYNCLSTGFIVGFTPSGNPRVLEYYKDRRDGSETLSNRPKAVGINSGVIKIEPVSNIKPE
jgi:hypothetical protein